MRVGKPLQEIMGQVYQLTGRRNSNVLVGPRHGIDTSIITHGSQVIICSTDPISFIPEIGPEKSALLSVHGIASDVATSGVGPKYALFDLNLPPTMTDTVLGRYWNGIHHACLGLGISIIGGHTGRFPGCDYTVVGGATMMTMASRNGFVTSGMARSGDVLIATKSAGIEAAAVLATSFPKTVSKKLGRTTVEEARNLVYQTSTVDDALTAASVGLREKGVTAMHDATEGGVLSAVLDMAEASGLKAYVVINWVPVFDEVRDVCDLFGIDPHRSLGQGSLLIASRPHAAMRVVGVLRKNRIQADVIGGLSGKQKDHVLLRKDGKNSSFRRGKMDPYWRAYWNGVRRGLN